jgi:hypothetical protein
MDSWPTLYLRTFRVASDHSKFAFRSPHQPVQICGLGRDACRKATGFKPPTVIEALGIGFDDKGEEAFAQSGQSLLYPLPVTHISKNSHNIYMNHKYSRKQGLLNRSEKKSLRRKKIGTAEIGSKG